MRRRLRLHPDNPHYFQWRGRPTILITSAEHYGAVMNLDFDYPVPRHAGRGRDELHADLQRRLRRARRRLQDRPQHPGAGARSLHRAVGAAAQPGYANGGNKFDLSRWDDAYFARLKDFVAYAAETNVVVEVTLFCPMYEEMQWTLSPMNAANNVNGVGAVRARRRLHARQARRAPGRAGGADAQDRHRAERVRQPVLRDLQRAYFGGVTVAWQHHIADVIVETEHGLPAQHLIAQNIANKTAKIVNPHPAVSIFNFHYATPPDAVGRTTRSTKSLATTRRASAASRMRPIEPKRGTSSSPAAALYNNLDYSFTAGHEDGTFVYPTTQPGGGNRALRRQLKILSGFINGFEFIRMSPDNSAIKGGAAGRRDAPALVEPGKAMAVDVRKESVLPWSGAVDWIIEAPSTGEYTFHTFSNDGIRLRVNDTLLIEDWTDHGEKEDAGRITLTAGQRYAVQIEYFYNGGQGVAKLCWTPPGGTKEAVPERALHLPAGGRGLRGEYFKGADLSEAWAQRDDAQINFAWGVTPSASQQGPLPSRFSSPTASGTPSGSTRSPGPSQARDVHPANVPGRILCAEDQLGAARKELGVLAVQSWTRSPA